MLTNMLVKYLFSLISTAWCGLTAGPRTEGEVGVGGGRKAWTNGGEVEEIKTCVNILQLNRWR